MLSFRNQSPLHLVYTNGDRPMRRTGASLGLVVVLLISVGGCGRAIGPAASVGTSPSSSGIAVSPSSGTPYATSASPSSQTCASPSKPSARELTAVVYQANKGQIVIFGGFSASGSGSPLGDTWTWQSGCWSSIQTATAPSAREEMAIAYFPPMSLSIAYGGRTGATQSTDSNETWTWDGSTWRPVATNLPMLHSPMMAFDGHTHIVLLGYTDDGTSETWLWDGANWTEQQSSPPARSQGTLAFDPVSGRVILFGGLGLQNMNLLSDTWAWSGSQWLQLAPAHSPTPRLGAAMTSFVSQSEMVLVGGFSRGSILGDVWVWSGADWRQAPDFQPRTFAAAVDTGTTVIVFGGANSSGDESELFGWDGSSWAQL